MLKINTTDWLDLNILGVGFALILSVVILFYPIIWYLLIFLEIFVLSISYYFYSAIKANQNTSILVNSENNWFLENDGNLSAVQLKDHWIQVAQIFIWLEGSNKSISLVVSRSIIGADKFSQLRTKIT